MNEEIGGCDTAAALQRLQLALLPDVLLNAVLPRAPLHGVVAVAAFQKEWILDRY